MDPSPARPAPPSPSAAAGQPAEPQRAPSLLPAFEPLSSSPFPRAYSAKRKFVEGSPTSAKAEPKHYPTPVPTSSTGMLLSSSPQPPAMGLHISALTERVPLGAVPSLELPANGDPVLMGRSSNSTHFQLSANRLISRVHVRAAYHAPSDLAPHGHVQIECLGWNGAKIHTLGKVFPLDKGKKYESKNPDAEIMVDVQETRVMITWPVPSTRGAWDSDEEDTTPTRQGHVDHFASSPPAIPRSPLSQSPVRGLGLVAAAPAPVQVFEDDDAADEALNANANTPTQADATFIRPTAFGSASEQESSARDVEASLDLSFDVDDFSDGDEENDPVVHSFGPFGENLLPRFSSFSAATPAQTSDSARRRRPLFTDPSPQRLSTEPRFNESPVKNHVINQLAFSRIHSLPLSTIHGNLPAELKACIADTDETNNGGAREASSTPVEMSKQELKKIMDGIACVGEIPRSGNDAAGKPLENEFYYVPEMDTDEARRDTITSGIRGNGLRSVRKQHKQYYWKKPRV